MREFNHKCMRKCSHGKCANTTKLLQCKACHERLVCTTHNQGANIYVLCDQCLQSDINCVSCKGKLSSSEKRRGQTRHETCPIARHRKCSRCKENLSEDEILQQLTEHVKCNTTRRVSFEFKHSPFSIFWALDPDHKKFHTKDFTTLFNHIFNKFVYDGSEFHTSHVSELLMSWRVAILALYRRNDISLRQKTTKSTIAIFSKSDDPKMNDRITKFITGDRLYHHGDVDYNILSSQYNIDSLSIQRLITYMYSMLIYFHNAPKPTPITMSAKKTGADKNSKTINNFKQIYTFTDYLMKLIPNHKPTSQLRPFYDIYPKQNKMYPHFYLLLLLSGKNQQSLNQKQLMSKWRPY